MTATHWLFSYGTLRQPEVQMALFGRLVETRDDVLPAFKVESVRITDPAVVALSGAAEHPILKRGAPEDLVTGAALATTDADLARADGYESADYRRIAVTLASGRSAFVYVHKDEQP